MLPFVILICVVFTTAVFCIYEKGYKEGVSWQKNADDKYKRSRVFEEQEDGKESKK